MRRFTEKAPKPLLFKLQQKSVTPDSLLKDIKNAKGKPYLEICGPESEEVKAEKWLELENLFLKAIEIWREESDLITQLLTNPALEKHYYKAIVDNIDSILSEMNSFAKFDKPPYQIDTKKMKWLGTEPKLKKTAKLEPIDHHFFQAWQAYLDLWEELDASSDDFLNNTRIKLIHYLQNELPAEKTTFGRSIL